jgi:hypothetical protein
MSIVNRRNAVVGWVVLKAGKRAAKRKAQDATTARTGGMLASALAAVAGLLVLRRKKRSGDSGE